MASDQQVAGLAGAAGLSTAIRRRASASRRPHHRPDALRRLWPARSVHHVYAAESISRGAGSEAEFQRIPRPARSVYPHGMGGGASVVRAGRPPRSLGRTSSCGRTSDRDFHRAATSTPAPPATSSAQPRSSTTAFPNGGQVPLSAFTHIETTSGAHHREPSGPVPGGDAVVQSGARTRRWATR